MLPALEKGSLISLAANPEGLSNTPESVVNENDKMGSEHLKSIKNEPSQYQQQFGYHSAGLGASGHLAKVSSSYGSTDPSLLNPADLMAYSNKNALHHMSRFNNNNNLSSIYGNQHQQQQPSLQMSADSFYMNSLSGYKLPASPSSTSSSSSSSCSSYSIPSSANFNYSLPFYSAGMNGYSNQNLNAPSFMPSSISNQSKSQSFDSTGSNEEGTLRR